MFFYGGFGTTWEYLLQYPKELNMVGHMITLMFKRAVEFLCSCGFILRRRNISSLLSLM